MVPTTAIFLRGGEGGVWEVAVYIKEVMASSFDDFFFFA